MSERKLLSVPISQIKENPVALRAVNREGETFLEMIDSVKSHGIIDPISVREKQEGDGDVFYEIINGLHRYSAAIEAGLKEIPVHVIPMSDADVLMAQIIANVHKVETRPVEYSQQLRRILAGTPLMTMAELATKVGKTPGWIGERFGLLKLEEQIAKLVDDSKINLSNAYALAKLPPEEQAAYVDSAMTTPPAEFVPTVNQRVKEIKEAAREGRKAGPAEFVPTPYSQKVGDIKTELEKLTVVKSLIKKAAAKTAEEGAALAIAWVLHMDVESIAESRAKYDQKMAAKEEAKQRRAAEKAKAKAEKAATEAAKLEEAAT